MSFYTIFGPKPNQDSKMSNIPFSNKWANQLMELLKQSSPNLWSWFLEMKIWVSECDITNVDSEKNLIIIV